MRVKINKFSQKQRIILHLIIALTIFLSGIAQAEEKFNLNSRLSLKISGGLNHMNIGDINTFVESKYEFAKAFAEYCNNPHTGWEFSVIGEIEKLKWGHDFEQELCLTITPKFEVGIGVGYIHGRNKSYFISRQVSTMKISGLHTDASSIEPRVTAIPVKLGIYYRFPFIFKTKLFTNVGIGYYFAKSSLNWKMEEYDEDIYYHSSSFSSGECKVSSNGFGFHGGIGIEYSLTKNLSLIIEGQGRYVRIKNLKGENLGVGDSKFSPEGVSGTLYSYKSGTFGNFFFNFILSEEKPDNAYWRNWRDIRETILDLSGFSLRVGIRIKLF